MNQENEDKMEEVAREINYIKPYRKDNKMMKSRESLFNETGSVYQAAKYGLTADTQEMESVISSWKTPLHNAAAEGRCDELNLLLQHPNININIQTKRYNDYEGIIKLDNTPLHLAAENGQEQAVAILLKNGALFDIQNSDGATPLHLATINGVCYEIVENLAKDKSILEIKDSKGRTPLFCAAVEGWHNLIPILAGTGNLIEETDVLGVSPLIAATNNGFSHTMKLLIEMGAHLSKRDKTGNSAIDYAIKADEKSIQDEQVFDGILSQMLSSQSKDIALSYLQNLLSKYNRLKLKQSIFTLFDRIPELRATKVIIRTKYLESDENGLTPDQKEYDRRATTALQMIADTKDADLAFHPCIRTVVNKKMSKIGNYFLLLELLYNLTFLFCMGFVLIAAAAKPNPKTYDNSSDYARAVFEVITILFWMSLVIGFILGISTGMVWEYHRGGSADDEKEEVKKPSAINMLYHSVLHLAIDPYNYYTLFWIISLFLVLPLRVGESPAQWVFAVFAVTFGFLRLIKIIRLLPGFGTYVHTITLILLYDVPKFSIVCLTLILMLSECFFLSLRVPYNSIKPDNISASELGVDGLTSELYWTILLYIRVLLESQSLLDDNYLFNQLNWLSSIIYLTGLMLFIIILVNIFIAQVSDTYASSKSKSERVVSFYRLEYIVRLKVETFGLISKIGYIKNIMLKGNYWRSLQKNSDDIYEEVLCKLEKQQSKIDQIKQYIITLKKMVQSMNEKNSNPPSIVSIYEAMYNRGETPDTIEHKL